MSASIGMLQQLSQRPFTTAATKAPMLAQGQAAPVFANYA
jgi:hypothetical protein